MCNTHILLLTKICSTESRPVQVQIFASSIYKNFPVQNFTGLEIVLAYPPITCWRQFPENLSAIIFTDRRTATSICFCILFNVLQYVLFDLFKERNITHNTGETTSINILFFNQIILKCRCIFMPTVDEYKLWGDASFLFQFVNCSPQ